MAIDRAHRALARRCARCIVRVARWVIDELSGGGVIEGNSTAEIGGGADRFDITSLSNANISVYCQIY